MVGVPAETGEGIASAEAGAGASEGCETPDVGAGMKFQESSKPSQWLSHLFVPLKSYFKAKCDLAAIVV